MTRLTGAREMLESRRFTPRDLADLGLKVNQDGKRRNGMEVLSLPQAEFTVLERLNPELGGIDGECREQLGKDALYMSYIQRQERDAALLKRDEAQVIPEHFDYLAIRGLSNELKEKLGRARPANLAQAGRIDGMTPAALTLILSRLRQEQRGKIA